MVHEPQASQRPLQGQGELQTPLWHPLFLPSLLKLVLCTPVPALLAKAAPHKWHPPFPSLVLAFLMTGGRAGCWGLAGSAGAMVTVSTAAATAAAAAAAELPLKGLLALNSRHLAPSTVIILDMGILGFFLAIRGLQGRGEERRTMC